MPGETLPTTPMIECLPIATLPGTSALFRDYAESSTMSASTPGNALNAELLRRCYPADPFSMAWAGTSPVLSDDHRERLADELLRQAQGWSSGESSRTSIEKLRRGAGAVVTGQQVGLFGGPLLTLLKAATAIRKAQDASLSTGREYVPVFWLATEDHDLAEVDTVAIPAKTGIEHLSLGLRVDRPVPVGAIPLLSAGEPALEAAIERASELLGWGPSADLLRDCYAAEGATLASAYASFLSRVFAEFGLIVLDASSRAIHALGAPVLRAAVERVAELEAALLARSSELEAAGYHAQVLVKPGHSLLFLIDDAGARVPLRRSVEADGAELWRAGHESFRTAELLAMLDAAPERLSPNALLRPVMQDAILPTAAYVGGPAEIAYFAQSAVVYDALLGRVTPVLPRLSATLISPAIANVMDAHEITIEQIFAARTADELALRMGARSMPIEGMRKLAAAGNALDSELSALLDYMTAMSADLGRTAQVSASKMRYQMNRLRRMAARFELEKSAALRRQAETILLQLLPEGHLQERVLAGVWALALFGDNLPGLLVEHAGQECPGHRVIRL
jgi:bacillithiol biosynthesis cysteine-adding enzyme BshC